MKLTCSNPNCRLTFENTSITGKSGSFVIGGNVGVNCPRCGNYVAIPNGRYTFDKNGLSIVLRDLPKEDLIKIYEVAQIALNQNTTANEFKTAIGEINPGYKTLFDKFIEGITFDRFLAFLGFLISLLAYVHPLNTNTSNKVDQTIINNYNIYPNQSYSKNFEKSLRERNLNNSNKRIPNKAKHKQKRKPSMWKKKNLLKSSFPVISTMINAR